MVKDKPFIHLFKTPGGYYVYDVNTNRILKTGKRVYEHLENMQKNTGDESKPGMEVDQAMVKMKNDGFLSSLRMSEIVHPVDDMLPFYLENKLRMITLQVTQQCNLRCKYCIYSGNYLSRTHSGKRMSLDMAKKGIDFLVNHSQNSSSIAVGFYGGEPLLEMELLKNCIEYAEEKAEGKKIIFNVTTNGTLIDEGIIEYFEAHDVVLLISLDGPRESHDKNRRFAASGCGTFDKIMENLEKVKGKYPEYFSKISFNMVIDPENSFSCANEFVSNYDTIKDSYFSSSVVSNFYSKKEINLTETYDRERGYEMFKGLLAELGKIDSKYVSKLISPYFSKMKLNMHDDREYFTRLPEKGHHNGPCIPGVHRLFMNADGNLFPCERVSESSEIMKIGNIDSGYEIEKVRRLLNVGKVSEENCKNCWAFRYCELCAASADVLTDLSKGEKTSHCAAIRRSTEGTFKDYCTLREFGHSFEDKNLLTYGL